jgi:phosphoribosylformimino-5-aminoimidazole carboxamide ribotide isomerase
MKALFAMDLINRQAVRLRKGDFRDVTVYSSDPLERIAGMVGCGARDFHIIDLDGARTGDPQHRDLIAAIRQKVPGYMEVGGGIRTVETVAEYAGMGVDGIIVGTAALEDETFLERCGAYRNIVLGLDLLEGKPMARGWKSVVERDVGEILRASEGIGVMAVLCTSIARDGMLMGPDYEAMEKVQALTRLPLIASGGVTTIGDVRRLKDMGVWATILGKAVYEGLIQIEEAMDYAD